MTIHNGQHQWGPTERQEKGEGRHFCVEKTEWTKGECLAKGRNIFLDTLTVHRRP